MITRHLTLADWPDAKTLYEQLNTQSVTSMGTASETLFAAVLSHSGTSVFGAEHEGSIKAMVTLHLLPNVTYGGRPCGLIENVVTDVSMRGSGLGRLVMEAAIAAAWKAEAYKVMLLTGKANAATGFYEKLGFSQDEKAGMILRNN